MTTSVVYLQGRAEVVIPAGSSIAVLSISDVAVSRKIGYPNHPDSLSLLGIVNQNVVSGQSVFGPYASGATIVLEASAAWANYEVGVAPVVQSFYGGKPQSTPPALDATGALTAAMILAGLMTSSTAAAVAGTVPTGTVMDQASQFTIGDSFDWSIINTGPNAFTVTAAAGHTLIGTAVVATVTSGQFRTRKTAAATFVTYRIG